MAATRTSKVKITKPAAKAADHPAADSAAIPATGEANDGGTPDSQAQPKAAPTKAAQVAKQSHERIAVRSIAPSFRRAGLQFSRAETVIDVRDLTHEQRHALESESRLIVRAVTSPGTAEI